jgi:dihydroxy-acid dehydratase
MLRCAVALAQASSLRQANGIGLRRAFSADVLNKVSATITQPKSQGASQAMLYATGLKEEDMKKAQACWRAAAVGFSVWSVV